VIIMKKTNYQFMDNQFSLKRREFLKTGSVVGPGTVLGSPTVWQGEKIIVASLYKINHIVA